MRKIAGLATPPLLRLQHCRHQHSTTIFYILYYPALCSCTMQYSTAVLFLSSWYVTVHAIALLYSAIYLLTLEEDSSQSAGCSEATIIGNPPSHLILHAPPTPSDRDFRLHSIQDYFSPSRKSVEMLPIQLKVITSVISNLDCSIKLQVPLWTPFFAQK